MPEVWARCRSVQGESAKGKRREGRVSTIFNSRPTTDWRNPSRVEKMILFTACAINFTDLVKHKTKKIKIIVKGAETFFGIKEMSWEHVHWEHVHKRLGGRWEVRRTRREDSLIFIQWMGKSLKDSLRILERNRRLSVFRKPDFDQVWILLLKSY